mgnify:CR=1 FL=1
MIYQVSHAAELRDGQLIDLPASKSLSNRALIMQALCPEPCQLTHLSDCDDTVVMQRAFQKMKSNLMSGPVTIDIGAAGTSMRFLTAYFATREGAEVIMTGTERMKQRPIKILVDALRELGAEIEYLETEGCPPLRIHGHKLNGGPLSIDGSTSSQYISALLMVAPTLAQGLQLTLTGDVTSRPYILMTLGMMREFGIESTWEGQVISISPQTYKAQRYEVESDWSAASYWYEVLALAHDTTLTTIRLKGLHKESLQGDSHVADYFEPMGIVTEYTDEGVVLSYGDDGFLMPVRLDWDMTEQPDLAQTVITTYAMLGIKFDISGLHTLRIKETDRITALENELKKMGLIVTDRDNDRMIYEAEEIEGFDYELNVTPVIKTYKDHRMAMAFAPLALYLDQNTLLIEDPAVVTKSYPQYWEHLKQIGFLIKEFKSTEESHTAIAKEKNEQKKRHSMTVLKENLRGLLIILLLFLMAYLLRDYL